MFRCEKCNRITVPGEKATRLVTVERDVEYPSRNYKIGEVKFYDPGGYGTEIVKEILICEECARTKREKSKNPLSTVLSWFTEAESRFRLGK
jgi:hypothetical protein